MRLSRAHVATPIAIAPATPKEIRITPLGLFVVGIAIFSARIGYKIIEKKSAPCTIRRKREVPRVVFAGGGNKILGNGVWDSATHGSVRQARSNLCGFRADLEGTRGGR